MFVVSSRQTFLTFPFQTQVAFIFGRFFFSAVVFVFMVYVSAFVGFVFGSFLALFSVLFLVLRSVYEIKHCFPCNSRVF